MAISGTDMDPGTIRKLVTEYRAMGISDADIMRIIETGANPEDLKKQYDMSRFLRQGALSQEGAGNPFGALAQGLMGYQAGVQDREFKQTMKDYRDFIRDKKQFIINKSFPAREGDYRSSDFDKHRGTEELPDDQKVDYFAQGETGEEANPFAAGEDIYPEDLADFGSFGGGGTY